MLTAVATFLLLLAALLAVPVTCTFRTSWPQVSQNDVRLRWALGLVRMRIPAAQPDAPVPDDLDLEDEALRSEFPWFNIKKGNVKKAKVKKVLAIVRRRPFRRRIARFTADVWRSVKKTDLKLRIRIGLDDPAATGQLWAFFGPLSGALTNVQSASIRLEPEFAASVLEVRSSGSVRIVPLQLVYLFVTLLLSKPVWQMLRHMRST